MIYIKELNFYNPVYENLGYTPIKYATYKYTCFTHFAKNVIIDVKSELEFRYENNMTLVLLQRLLKGRVKYIHVSYVDGTLVSVLKLRNDLDFSSNLLDFMKNKELAIKYKVK